MKLFSMGYCAELAEAVRLGNSIDEYGNKLFQPDAAKCIDAPAITLSDKIPVLGGNGNDTSAAIAIYKYLGDLNELQASDKRLWTTLTHTTFRQYVNDRWPAKSADLEAKKNAIMRRWFAEGGSDRTLENNAIARLWWGAHLTFAPWKMNPDEFGHLENEDDFYYTKRLFSLQELIKVTMESSLGRSTKVLIALLAYLDKHPELVNNEDVGDLMKELNLISGANKILVLSAKELEVLIEEAADSLFSSRTSTYAVS
jgi:hypothetical protein